MTSIWTGKLQRVQVPAMFSVFDHAFQCERKMSTHFICEHFQFFPTNVWQISQKIIVGQNQNGWLITNDLILVICNSINHAMHAVICNSMMHIKTTDYIRPYNSNFITFVLI